MPNGIFAWIITDSLRGIQECDSLVMLDFMDL